MERETLVTLSRAFIQANKGMQGVGEAQRREELFLCRSEEGFPEEMLELGLKEL